MQLASVNGHIVIIIMGIPLIVFLVKNLKERRLENLVNSTIDDIKSDSDALI